MSEDNIIKMIDVKMSTANTCALGGRRDRTLVLFIVLQQQASIEAITSTPKAHRMDIEASKFGLKDAIMAHDPPMRRRISMVIPSMFIGIHISDSFWDGLHLNGTDLPLLP